MTLSVGQFLGYGVTVLGGSFQYGIVPVTDGARALTLGFPAHFVFNASAALVDPMTDETGQAIAAALAKPATIASGQLAITTVGKAIQIPAGTLLSGLNVKAAASNQGRIFIGSSAAVTTVLDGTGSGYPLEAGETATMSVSDGSAVWVVGTVAGDVVAFLKH